MTTGSPDVAKCKLKELYREACRLYPCLLALQIVDQSPARRISRDELRRRLLREAKNLNKYLKSSSLPGAVQSESTAHYYLATCVALGLLERLGDVSARPDFTLTPRAVVIALGQNIAQDSKYWQLNPTLRFFCSKLLWEDDGACFGRLLGLFWKSKSLAELYASFSDAYSSREQFIHIMKPHAEWLVDLGFFERKEKQRGAVYVDSALLANRQTLRRLLSSRYELVEACLIQLFLKGNKPLPTNQIDDYVKYSYLILEEQGYQFAGEYVSVAALVDVAQLLIAISGRSAPRKAIEKVIVNLMDANRNHVSSMEAMTEEIGLGSPVQYGLVPVSYLRFLDRDMLRPSRTPNKLRIDRINTFLGR